MIKRVIIKNFRPFYGESDVVLTPGVNIVRGYPGGGKTNFINAIIWGLGNTKFTYMEHYESGTPLYNRHKYEELEYGDLMEVYVQIDLTFREDDVRFLRRMEVKKDLQAAVISDLTRVWVNDIEYPYPDLISDVIFNFDSMNMWYITSEINRRYRTLNKLVEKTVNVNRVERIYRHVLNIIYFRDYVPNVIFDSKNKLIEIKDSLSSEDFIFVYLCIWYSVLEHEGMLKDTNKIYLVDGIDLELSFGRAEKLNYIWKNFNQIIICCYVGRGELKWNASNIIEIDQERDYKMTIRNVK